MKLFLSLLQSTAFILTTSAYAALVPETYRAKSSSFYSQCFVAKQRWSQFQEHIRGLLVTTMPESVRDNIDSFLADDPEGLSQEETLSAFSDDFVSLAIGDDPLMHYLMRN